MSHIDTLKVYKELISGGMSSEQADIQIKAYEAMGHTFFNEMKQWLADAKQDFASQKLISIIGALILAVGIGCISMLWRATIDLELLKEGLQTQAAQIERLSMFRVGH